MDYFETEIRVRYAETDKMGIVHNANYLAWFDIVRVELFRTLSHSYRELDDEGIFFPVVEAHCHYLVPARFDDVILLRLKVKTLSYAKVAFDYEVIRKDDGVLLATGSSVHGFSNSAGKPGSIKKWRPELWEEFQKLLTDHTAKG
jgi:acyl-CoA thioester hydrolase